MTNVLDAYIELGLYTHALVIHCGEYSVHTTIHRTDVKLPPIDPHSLKGRQMQWVLGKIAGIDVGEFPRD